MRPPNARTSEGRETLAAWHVPNTPRTHDADGHPVDEPVQCARDLQAWPCMTRQLLDVIAGLEAQ